MSTDDLIASLCADGRVDSQGGFTLDRDRAREKLRTFQVAEPHRYVLHLVALAALRGATAVAFEIDTDDVWVRFDGEPLTAQDFEDLYSSSFAAAVTDADRARQQLAVGINAALALNPRRVRVTSGPPGARVRLEVRHDAEDAIARAPDDAGAGTVIHVKQRFRPGLVVRFFRHVLRGMPEEAVLRERVAFAAIPISINGAAIGGEVEARAGLVQCRQELRDEEGRVCVAGLRRDPHAAAEVRLIRHGVWISTLHPPHLPGGAIALVRDDSLQTDLSGQEVVHNLARERCLALVERTVEAVLVDYLDAHGGAGDPWGRARLSRSWLAWPRMREASTPLGQAVGALPWWADIFGRPLTLAALRACLERQQAVLYTASEFAGRLEAFSDTVVAVPPKASGDPSDDLLILRELFGERLRDHTRELEREFRRAANRRLWRARPTAPTVEPERCSALAPIRVETAEGPIEGQVGLRRERSGPATVRVIADGHLLCELSRSLPLPIDAAIGGLAHGDGYEGPPRDGRTALALLALLDGALWLIEKDMSERTCNQFDGETRALAQQWLKLRHHPEGPRGWLQSFGFPVTQAERALAQPGVAALPRICLAWAPVPTARLLEPWIAECERLPTACGRSLSLGALGLALARGERVSWTDERVPLLTQLDRIVLSLDRAAQGLVALVFGDRVAQLTGDEVQALVAEQRFMVQEEEEPALALGSCGAQVRVQDGPLTAVLGVRSFRDGEPSRARVRVLVRGRKLAERTTWAPFAGVVAVVRDDRLTPTADWSDIVDDAAWQAVEHALLQALPRLVEEALRSVPSGLIGDVLAASFPSATMRRAWERLVEVEGATAGEASYELLLGLASQVPLAQLDEVLEPALRAPPRLVGERRVHALGNLAKLAIDAGGRIDPARARAIAGVLREIRAHCGQHRPGGSLAQQVVAGDGPLFHELAFRRADGALVTLAGLIELRARGETIETVSAGAEPARRPHALVLDDAEDLLLLRLLGTEARRRGQVEERLVTLRPTVLPQAPQDALARVFVRGSDVAGELWIPAGAAEEDCRVALHGVDGALIKRVSLLPPLPLGGALTGEGARAEGFRLELSPEALRTVRDAAARLYDELLCRDDPAALLAIRRIDGRVGEARMPSTLEPLRQRLRSIAHAAAPDAAGPGSAPSELQDVLGDMFSELEAAARRHTTPREPEPGPARGPIVPSPTLPETPEVRLLSAIRRELRGLREQHERLLSNFNLDHLRLAALGPRAEPVTLGVEAVVLNKSHPLIERAAAEFDRDPWWVDALASLVFTAFNVWREEITDADEQTFHRLHLERVSRRSLAAAR